MTQVLQEKIRNKENCYGLYLSLSDSAVIELAALAGFDFVRIDLEHSLISQSELREMIRVSNLCGMPVFVRLAGTDMASAVLDAGADGLIITHVDSVAAARKAVQETKFAPYGCRGMALSQRSSKYGRLKPGEYIESSNCNVMLCVQIEDKAGVECAEEILSVPGIDMVSSGRNDLSQSYGLIGQNTHPSVIAAEDRIIEIALSHGVTPVLLISSKKRRDDLNKKGVFCFNVGRDTSLLLSAMEQKMKQFLE